jgi:hypothetical protein
MAVTIRNNRPGPVVLRDALDDAPVTAVHGERVVLNAFDQKDPVNAGLIASGEITVSDADEEESEKAHAAASKRAADKGQEPPSKLAAWAKAPETVEIAGEAVAFEPVLERAFKDSDLTVSAWNKLTVAQRQAYVEAAIGSLAAEAGKAKPE